MTLDTRGGYAGPRLRCYDAHTMAEIPQVFYYDDDKFIVGRYLSPLRVLGDGTVPCVWETRRLALEEIA